MLYTPARAITAAVTFVLAVSGCSTVAVKQGEGKSATNVGGVPFYIKKNVYKQITTYAQTDWDVTVTLEFLNQDATKSGGPRTLIQATIPDSAYRGDAMGLIRAEISKSNASNGLTQSGFDDAMRRLVEAGALLQSSPAKSDCSKDGDAYCPMVSNRLVREMVVDTSKMYYINGRRPLAGNAKTDFDLSSDMTLTKVHTEQEDKTLEQVLSVLPVKEYLSKELGLVAKPDKKDDTKAGMVNFLEMSGAPRQLAQKAVDNQATVFFRLALNATPRVLLHDVSKTLDGPEKLGAAFKLSDGRSGQPGYLYEVRTLEAGAAKEEEKKDAPPGYTINGTISLPTTEKTEAAKEGG